VLAPLAAAALQWQGFAALPGIFTILACLVVNQMAFVLAIQLNRVASRLRNDGPTIDFL
jgi:hypothetical protein